MGGGGNRPEKPMPQDPKQVVEAVQKEAKEDGTPNTTAPQRADKATPSHKMDQMRDSSKRQAMR
eukprot:867691-Prorocentrum_lima.AAC.1